VGGTTLVVAASSVVECCDREASAHGILVRSGDGLGLACLIRITVASCLCRAGRVIGSRWPRVGCAVR
jgi:hypothetical protein